MINSGTELMAGDNSPLEIVKGSTLLSHFIEVSLKVVRWLNM